MKMAARACLILWSSADKTLDHGERRQELEKSVSWMKIAHDVAVGFTVTVKTVMSGAVSLAFKDSKSS